ncbi:hypothetical protein BD410DRAFT_834652 [Rickenella mellea]|uniref:protein-tyrosine-phosphatase n=1 Tax=Rickenella mellea TaxID=50990 RepID=A0A4Y7QLP1_9AGAM|nr:hypothetical protein BD410DRAFT_834652 [Rickenella mellea]
MAMHQSHPQRSMPHKRGPPTALRIDTPPLIHSHSSASLSSATSDFDSPVTSVSAKPRSLRNMKRLSLVLPSAHSNLSSNSLAIPEPEPEPQPSTRRRSSIISLPNASISTILHRKDEDESPSAPYIDGPVQILPGIWLGSEDNARDWKCLVERGIKSILNVAKEVNSPFDSLAAQPLRPFASTPNLHESFTTSGNFYPAHGPSGRPAMHYLKLPWSHGQSDLVADGFVSAMDFVDEAVDRGDGVLVHCQCGVSRSATIVIALVMRAAATASPLVPPEVWELKSGGMHAAYAFVKSKSKWVGPNMSLIYQLLEYERVLCGRSKSPSASERSSLVAEEEEEWSRQRRLMDDEPSPDAFSERESAEIMREARALDKAMEERVVARKASNSSVGSSTGIGMGAAWKTRYGGGRTRAGSVASNFTTGSVLSEDLVEEDEEADLLGVGGGFDGQSISARSPSTETNEEDSAMSIGGEPRTLTQPRYLPGTPMTARPDLSSTRTQNSVDHLPNFELPPPSAPPTRSSFNLPPQRGIKPKRRPPPLGLLPPVPSSPVVPVIPDSVQVTIPSRRQRTESRKPAPPPLHLLDAKRHKRTPSSASALSGISTPSQTQTLFVFPPSPKTSDSMSRTPSTLTLMSNLRPESTLAVNGTSLPFPSLHTPRVSTFKGGHGRSRSFIGLGVPATPTTACSRVDVRGWVGALAS